MIRSCLHRYSIISDELEKFAAPFFAFAMRFWIGLIFFRSGLQKVGDWESTIFLFEDEYKLPLLSPQFAAAIATTFELAMPVLLFFGLATRLSALPLLSMAVVIQFVLGASNPDYFHVEHYYWMFLLSFIIIFGPGKLSLDYVLKHRLGLMTEKPIQAADDASA